MLTRERIELEMGRMLGEPDRHGTAYDAIGCFVGILVNRITGKPGNTMYAEIKACDASLGTELCNMAGKNDTGYSFHQIIHYYEDTHHIKLDFPPVPVENLPPQEVLQEA